MDGIVTADKLSVAEQERLDLLEARIHAGLESFFEVGKAMIEIRDARLYRERFDTWENYCANRWKMTGRHGYYQLAAMSKTVEISQFNPTVLPQVESQTRPIDSDFEPEQKGIIWNRAVQRAGGVPTAKIVKEERDRFVVEQARYPYVQALVNNCSLMPDKAAALVVELDAAPDVEMRTWLVSTEVRDPSLARELVRLYRDKRDSFSEIRSTGAIQSSQRTIALKNASVSDLRMYLDERQREHIAAAQEQKNADKEIRPISGLFWQNSPEKMYDELAKLLSTDDLRGLKTLFNARVT